MPRIAGRGGQELLTGSVSRKTREAIGGLVTRGVEAVKGAARKVGRKLERRETLAPPRNIAGRRG